MPDAPPSTDSTQLWSVVRAQLGDRAALEVVLRAIQGPLFRHISAVLGDPDGAEDVLQDVLLIISRRLGTLRDPRWFRAWAYRIATRAALRQARQARRHLLVSLEEWHDAPAAVEEHEEWPDTAALLAQLEHVSPSSAVVLRLRYLDGLSYVEIAEALELNVGTVKSRLAYGLATLRRRMRATS